MGKIYIVVAETMGTNVGFYSEVYPYSSQQEAEECATSLIADIAETMGVKGEIDTYTWRLEGENWWFRVRIECHSIPCNSEDENDIDEQ